MNYKPALLGSALLLSYFLIRKGSANLIPKEHIGLLFTVSVAGGVFGGSLVLGLLGKEHEAKSVEPVVVKQKIGG
jgi:hypothetical protein